MYEDRWTRTKDVKRRVAPSRAPLSVLTISKSVQAVPGCCLVGRDTNPSGKRVSSLLPLPLSPAGGVAGVVSDREVVNKLMWGKSSPKDWET